MERKASKKRAKALKKIALKKKEMQTEAKKVKKSGRLRDKKERSPSSEKEKSKYDYTDAYRKHVGDVKRGILGKELRPASEALEKDEVNRRNARKKYFKDKPAEQKRYQKMLIEREKKKKRKAKVVVG